MFLPPLIRLHHIARAALRRRLALIVAAADQEQGEQHGGEENTRPNDQVGIALLADRNRHGTLSLELPGGKAGTAGMVPGEPLGVRLS